MSLRNKIAIWSLLVVILIFVVSIRWIQPSYRTARMWLFLRMADQAIERKDYGSASLAFRKALLSGYENPASWKRLAKFLEEVHSPEIIGVWERLANMEPTVPQHRYNQIAAALQFGRTYQAEELIGRLPSALLETPEGLRLRAEVATRKRQFPQAGQLLEKLVALRPDDKKAQFDLYCIRANSEDPAVSGLAREKLKEVAATESEFTAAAMRRLVAIAKENGDTYEADRIAGRLASRQDATAQDQITYVQLEGLINSFTLPMAVASLRDYAARHPADFGAIVEWLVASKVDLSGTGRWIAEIPPEARILPHIEPALFQYYLAAGDFDQVFRMLRNPASSLHCSAKVLDLAAKAIEEDRSGATSAEQTWIQAIYACEGKVQPLRILSSLASAVGWSGATGRALSALADASPGDPSAWWLLVQHESSVHNLAGMYKALGGLMRLNPYDITVASSWVLAASLVRQGDLDEVLGIAKRTYESTYPSDPRAATAYAMALLQADRNAEAMAVVDQMSLVDRREPQRAIYVGSVLAANGRMKEAFDYFDRSEVLERNSFPEERMLRRIWKGVASGEASTAEEARKIIADRDSAEGNTDKIQAELNSEIQRRSDPGELQRILSTLKTESESRRKMAPEVEKMMSDLRKGRKQ
jgi:tetratricopeptide (TPR) repeat protein